MYETQNRSELENYILFCLIYLTFWNLLTDYFHEYNIAIKSRKIMPLSWYEMDYGSSKSQISFSINPSENMLRCDIYIPNAKYLFHGFLAYKKLIENELGKELEWIELPEKKASIIRSSREGNIHDIFEWTEFIEWFAKEGSAFRQTFSKYVPKISKPKSI
jgi:hypothetical protein